MDLKLQFERAQGLMRARDLAGAGRLYAQILEASPGDFNAH